MRSRIHLNGHPLHPILIVFPIAFLLGTVVFDVLAYFQHTYLFFTMGQYLEGLGIIWGLAAAVPGIVDYYSLVPQGSSASKRGAKHGLLNVAMLTIFGVAFLYRRGTHVSPGLLVIMEGIAAVLLTIAGWHGGTLVHRNQIGVDHRYAEAGKWKEKYFRRKAEDQEIAAEDELEVNQMMLLHVDGDRIVLGRTEEGYYAFEDRCPHRGGVLSDGALMCGTVQCPWHGSQFDIKTGLVKAGPSKEGIHTYPVQCKEGKVFLTFKTTG
jgi:nitrite reductase/ring-hydroxylating ferredoxin subunit/uncharacterized membrane protein